MFCRGTKFPTGGPIGETNGFVSGLFEHTRPSDVTDGLSNTVAMSERLSTPLGLDSGVSKDSSEAIRYLWWTEQRFKTSGEEEQAAEQARNNRTSNFPPRWDALCYSYIPFVTYDHILPPNVPGSHNGREDFDSTRYIHVSLVPATSLHPGGVNILLADGSVRFNSSSVDLGVWRALGTRNGGETQ